jgi:hypothetical protein
MPYDVCRENLHSIIILLFFQHLINFYLCFLLFNVPIILGLNSEVPYVETIIKFPNFNNATNKLLFNYMIIDIVVDNCAICRNHIMDLCKLLSWFIFCSHYVFTFFWLFCVLIYFCGCLQASSAKPIRQVQPVRSVLLLGVCFMLFFKYRVNPVSLTFSLLTVKELFIVLLFIQWRR